MNKKGLTLVEVIAVIAIIAILSIAVIPNIITLFNKGKETNFISECQNVYKAAKNQYVLDRTKGYYEMTYQRGVLENDPNSNISKLDIEGREDFNYMIRINADNEVIYFFCYDKENTIELNNTNGPINLTDINENNVTKTVIQ